MAYPISIKKNNYFDNRKKSTVFTPLTLSSFIEKVIPNDYKVNGLDIACGLGNLSYYFQCKFIGIDWKECYKEPYENSSKHQRTFIKDDYLTRDCSDLKPSIIICNPPFNYEYKKTGKKLLPELFLKKMFIDFGDNVPVVMIVPMGFRLNQDINSKRILWMLSTKSEITSIISLPKNVFNNVKFHCEVLIFNIVGIKAHYWFNG